MNILIKEAQGQWGVAQCFPTLLLEEIANKMILENWATQLVSSP